MKIVDLHCDTIMRFYAGEHLRTLEHSHISLEKLKRGECMAQCFAIFVPTYAAAERGKITDTPAEYFEKAYAAYLRELELCGDSIRPAFCVDDILRHDAAGLMSAILTVEDCVTLDGRLEELDEYYRKGVRMAALTWNYENTLGYPQDPTGKVQRNGLKPFGIEAVRRMNELGIAVDVSHLSEGGFWDVVRHSKKPFVASHSCCRAYRDIPRNLTDEQLKAVGDRGGVVGVNFSHNFLRDVTDWNTDRWTTAEVVVKHLRHVVNTAGADAAAIGSDYDGIHSELEWGDCGGAQELVRAMEREFTPAETEKICSGNALRALREIIG